MKAKRTNRVAAAFGLLVAMVVIALGCTLSLTGCQSDERNQDSLSVWVKEADYRDYIQDVFELYETETGSQLNVRVVSDDTFSQEVIDAFRDGTAPDILMHYNDSELAKIGLDNFLVLNDQAWADSILSASRAYCDDGEGNLMGLPFWESSISGCYYNKKLLSELGLKPASTQAEFDMLCQAIKNVGYTPLFWGSDCGWMYQFGLDPVFADNPDLLRKLNEGEIDYADIPQVRDMVEWIYDAYNKGWLGNPLGKDIAAVSGAVGSGEAVMVDIWDTWFETDFEPGKYGIADFAIMPVFMGTSSEGTYEGGNLNMMIVNKHAKHLDDAVEFLEFCAQPEVINKVFDGVPSVRVFKDQDTISTADMIIEASESIATHERASTANPKIVGYRQADMKVAFDALFRGEVSVDECIARMDEMRKAAQNNAEH